MKCPSDPSHGPLIPLVGGERYGWYCPHQEHDGWKNRGRTRSFFRTAEAELAPGTMTEVMAANRGYGR